jgi:hypothetical protein
MSGPVSVVGELDGDQPAGVLGVVPAGFGLPASRLAEFHELPPAYLAKHLQALSRAGIVTANCGVSGGYRLAKPPAKITLLDITLAIEGPGPAFRCTEIRQRSIGISIGRRVRRSGIVFEDGSVESRIRRNPAERARFWAVGADTRR